MLWQRSAVRSTTGCIQSGLEKVIASYQLTPGKNVRRDPANPTWDPRLIPGGIPPEIGGIPPGIPPGILERPGRHPTWDPN